MKSEQEIEDRIEAIENFDIELYHLCKISCVIANLKWVLKDSEPKRTIFDLTKEELLELFYIAMPYLSSSKFIVSEHILNKLNNCVSFILEQEYPDFSIKWQVHIMANLTMDVLFNDSYEPIANQADYIHKIENMLNKEATK